MALLTLQRSEILQLAEDWFVFEEALEEAADFILEYEVPLCDYKT